MSDLQEEGPHIPISRLSTEYLTNWLDEIKDAEGTMMQMRRLAIQGELENRS